jgi:hypothetical protein
MLEPYFDRAILCKGSPAAKMFGSFAGQPASEDVQGGVQVAVNKLAALGGTAPSQSSDVSFHHSKESMAIFEKRLWKPLFIPPYSPWFNPIENIFGWVKTAYRKDPNISKAFEGIKPSAVQNAFEKALVTEGVV